MWHRRLWDASIDVQRQKMSIPGASGAQLGPTWPQHGPNMPSLLKGAEAGGGGLNSGGHKLMGSILLPQDRLLNLSEPRCWQVWAAIGGENHIKNNVFWTSDMKKHIGNNDFKRFYMNLSWFHMFLGKFRKILLVIVHKFSIRLYFFDPGIVIFILKTFMLLKAEIQEACFFYTF